MKIVRRRRYSPKREGGAAQADFSEQHIVEHAINDSDRMMCSVFPGYAVTYENV
jgi:hypothetical protein